MNLDSSIASGSAMVRACGSSSASAARLRRRQMKLLYPNHRLPPWPTEDDTLAIARTVMCQIWTTEETPWDFESTQPQGQRRVQASRGDGRKAVQRGLFAEQ